MVFREGLAVLELARRVKRGVRLLDKKVPGWRSMLRAHADKFDIKSPNCCILGTLGHKKPGKIRETSRWALAFECGPTAFDRGAARLGIRDKTHRFGFIKSGDIDCPVQYEILQVLWEAEFRSRTP